MPGMLFTAARSSQKLVGVGALVALLSAATPASAQVLCKCAQRSLAALICTDDLTARVRVRWGLSLPSGNQLYLARVLDVFRGSAGRDIWIETPAGCGLSLRPFTTYVVSVNRGDDGAYSTFACSSFVKPWREVTDEDMAVLEAPACAPSCDDVTCAAGEHCVLDPVVCVRAPCPPRPICVSDIAGPDEVCYRFSESDASVAMDRPCDVDHKCLSVSEMVGFNAERVCKLQNYCVNDDTADSDCAALPHPAVLGNWSCVEHACTWIAGEPKPKP